MTRHPIVLAGQYGSPYTLKMRGVLRYRHIPFRWTDEFVARFEVRRRKHRTQEKR